ncbi:pyridoxamine 5'-phosphate oxidase family protein [Bacillus smithii]|uniref:pyridoxamine 5'-phosphate oxidase family protein n=1 Tax=Bacillus smithii TaxID=1479 RepID=UPI002E21106E|nr:pyridoxamine 5'-phosphate oxidase family protein [Bacillus smithii]MED1457203.1 pyridoxamine 5'-phosphate oxidase family protein [Bacillus smithii]
MNTQEISTNLFQLLNGKDLASKQQEAMMLLTLSQDLWPHVAMISVGEVIAIRSTELKLSLWPNTITTSNIIRTGKATLVIIFNGIAHYIKLSLRKLPELADAKHKRERFSAKVVSYREDIAKYAEITSGIQIQLKDPASVLKRWNETIEDLLR